MLPLLLKPYPYSKLRSLFLLPLSLSFSTTAATSSSSANAAAAFHLPILPLSDPSLDLNPSELASSFKSWFQSGSSSPLDKIYAALSSAVDDTSLDAALSPLSLRLSETLVLSVLSHRPHPAAVPPASNLLLLRLKFFDWSGRQKSPYRHTRPAYHAVFRLLSRAHQVSVVLNWLHLFSSFRPSQRSPFGYIPRFHDTLIVGYAVAGRPELALHLLAKMRFQGLDLDAFAYHVLLNSLVESSLFDFADSVFAQIAARGLSNPVTDCLRVKSLCRQNKLDEAAAFLRDLQNSDGRVVAEQTVATLVHALCKKGRYEDAGRLVEEFGTAEAYGTWVMDLITAGKLDVAMEFLKSKKVLEDYVPEDLHYNKLIFHLLEKNRLQEAYDVLVEMMEEGLSPNRTTMNVVLCFFCKAGMVDVAIQLYHSREELGMSPSMGVYNHLINALCRSGNVEEVCQVLEESMQHGYFPGKQTFNILATMLCREGKIDNLRKLLDGALERKRKPVAAVFARYIAALCKAGELEEACLVPQMVRGTVGVGLGKYKYTYTSLIRAFISLGRIEVLPHLIIEMQEHGHSPSRSLYQAVVRSLCEMGRFEDVLDLLNKQLKLEVLDPLTCYNYFIDGAAHSKKPELAREVYNRMESEGVRPNKGTKILLLQGYLKSKRTSDALNFFHYLHYESEPSTRLYSIFISGLCEAGKVQQAVVFWREMRNKGMIPSLNCYEELVLSLCTNEDYDIVVRVLDDFKETGRQVSPFICNVLLFHTLKGQKLLRAWFQATDWKSEDKKNEVSEKAPVSGRLLLGQLIAAFSGGIRMRENLHNLDEVVEQYFPVDVYTYNMLLRGLTMAGRMDYVSNLFDRMRKKGYEPNRWTFDIIVHGFCKQGMRQDAERWMEEMYRNGYYPTWSTMSLYNNTA